MGWAVVTTLAGGVNGTNGVYFDATGTNAGFSGPTGVAVDASGNVFVADPGNQRIRKVDAIGGTRISPVAMWACCADMAMQQRSCAHALIIPSFHIRLCICPACASFSHYCILYMIYALICGVFEFDSDGKFSVAAWRCVWLCCVVMWWRLWLWWCE